MNDSTSIFYYQGIIYGKQFPKCVNYVNFYKSYVILVHLNKFKLALSIFHSRRRKQILKCTTTEV